MVEVKKISVLKALLCLVFVGAFGLTEAQERSSVPGMENNAQYQALLEQERALQRSQDSVLRQIDEARKAYASDTAQRQQYAQRILVLENQLYDVRNRIGVVGNAISSLEQEYIIGSMNDLSASRSEESVENSPGRATVSGNETGMLTSLSATTTPQETPAAATGPKEASSSTPSGTSRPTTQTPAGQLANLVYNSYFKEHLPVSDYQALIQSQEQELLPLEIIANYMANYKVMDSLARLYEEGERALAEDAYTKLQTLRSINDRLSDSLAQVWSYIYDNKTYIYSYLLDKMNESELLANFERQFRSLNQKIASGRDTVASEAIYAYPLRKKLTLDYEYTLANLLGYTRARDSIASVQRSVASLNFAFPEIDPARRNFIEYSEIKRSVPSIYNAKNPIPEAEIFQYGTVYRIQLGVFQRAQPVSLFRNVNPLSYDRLEDGRYRYCAGGFRELSEAQAALEEMKKIGFRQPKIVVWRDGVFESLDEDARSSSDQETVYRIEITGEGDVMTDRVKEVIETAAPDKEISRTTDAEGKYVYTIGMFSDRETAEELVSRLSGLEGVSAQVRTLEP